MVVWREIPMISAILTICCSCWSKVVQFLDQTVRQLVRTLSVIPLLKVVGRERRRLAFFVLTHDDFICVWIMAGGMKGRGIKETSLCFKLQRPKENLNCKCYVESTVGTTSVKD